MLFMFGRCFCKSHAGFPQRDKAAPLYVPIYGYHSDTIPRHRGLSEIYPRRGGSRNHNGVTPRVADTQNSGGILR